MSDPKDKFDEHENTELITMIEQIGSIIEKNYSEAIIIVNTDDKPIVWSKGDTYDLLKLCAPLIRNMKQKILNDIDC